MFENQIPKRNVEEQMILIVLLSVKNSKHDGNKISIPRKNRKITIFSIQIETAKSSLL